MNTKKDRWTRRKMGGQEEG